VEIGIDSARYISGHSPEPHRNFLADLDTRPFRFGASSRSSYRVSVQSMDDCLARNTSEAGSGPSSSVSGTGDRLKLIREIIGEAIPAEPHFPSAQEMEAYLKLDKRELVKEEHNKWKEMELAAGAFSGMKDTTSQRLLRLQCNLLATGPASTQVGDQVWIIKDARQPVVLRQIAESTHFTLMGQSYVHGIMYGEKMKMKPGLRRSRWNDFNDLAEKTCDLGV
jgi:hypothetical protein